MNRPKPVATPKWATAEVPPPSGVDALSADDVKKALSALRSDYVSPISEEQMNRATLRGLLDALSPSVTLSGSAEKTAEVPAFYSETYENRVGYLRLGDLSKNAAQAQAAVNEWMGKKIGAIILDLRSTPPSSDFGAAASLARIFCTQFTLQLTKGTSGSGFGAGSTSPPFGGLVVVLVDGDTAQAAEAVAAILRESAKAILVGDPTSGKSYEFTDVPLDHGMVLHVATAQANTGKGPLAGGLKPDIAEDRGGFNKADIVKEITAHGVARVVAEKSRAHLNEAALVAGRDPDIDTMEADQQASHQPAAAARPIDRQLQRALDLVTSISVFQARKAPPAADASNAE